MLQGLSSSIRACGDSARSSGRCNRATSTQASASRLASAGPPGIQRRSAAPCWSRCCLRARLDSTRACSSQGSTGLCRKSSAPSSMQRATGATPPSALVTMTATSRSAASVARACSRPKPSSSGMARSSSSSSKGCRFSSSSACRPFSALLTLWPISSRERHSSRRLTLLSSATSTRAPGCALNGGGNGDAVPWAGPAGSVKR